LKSLFQQVNEIMMDIIIRK